MMKQWLGFKKEKVWFEGKQQFINQINFSERKELQAIEEVLTLFLDETDAFKLKTSGSTGMPKILSLQKVHMLASAKKTIEVFQLKPSSKILLALSPNHIGGVMMLVRWLLGNLDLYVTQPSENPLKSLKQPMDFTALVPYQLANCLEDLPKVKTAIIGGGAISQALEEAAIKSPCLLYHTYGMTETISHIAIRKFGEKQTFKAVGDLTFKVDVRDCLCINAPHLEIKNLQTNDVVELIDETKFVWKGRYDNVVNSGGIKLHPELIEKKLEGFLYPFFLAGIPDDDFGEKLILIIEKSALKPEERAELLNWVAKRVDKYEKPKALFAVKTFLRTATNKIKRDVKRYTLSEI